MKNNRTEGTVEQVVHHYPFGGRTYDPALLRWTTPDPLSSKYPAWSP